MTTTQTTARARGGRPTKAAAEARSDALLAAALDQFLDKGFEPATIDAIAASVNMTKRTIYARYPDKVALFRAAVRKAIEDVAPPPEALRAARRDNLAATLRAVAELRVGQLMTPKGLKLQRIINTESYRFPDIFTTAYELGALPVVGFVAAILAEENAAGRLRIDDTLLAANIFLSMTASGPVRILVAGGYLPKAEIDRRIAYAVRLFLDGARA